MGLPRANGLAQSVHPPAMTDLRHHVRAPTQAPVEHLGRAKAAVHAEHDLPPALAGPSQMCFNLLEGRFQGRDSGCFPPEQRLVEHFPVWTRGDPEGFSAGFTAIASHPGALAPLCLRADGHGRHVNIHPQQALVESMVGRRSVPLQIIPGYALKLGDIVSRARPQRASNRRLVRTSLPPKGALHGRIEANRHVILGNGLGPTEDAN